MGCRAARFNSGNSADDLQCRWDANSQLTAIQRGFAHFFPLGRGYLGPEFPYGGIMMLGSEWGTEGNVADLNAPTADGQPREERASNPTRVRSLELIGGIRRGRSSKVKGKGVVYEFCHGRPRWLWQQQRKCIALVSPKGDSAERLRNALQRNFRAVTPPSTALRTGDVWQASPNKACGVHSRLLIPRITRNLRRTPSLRRPAHAQIPLLG